MYEGGGYGDRSHRDRSGRTGTRNYDDLAGPRLRERSRSRVDTRLSLPPQLTRSTESTDVAREMVQTVPLSGEGGRSIVSATSHATAVTIEDAINFLSSRGVLADDPGEQSKKFGYLRDPKTAPRGQEDLYAKRQRIAIKLVSLVNGGERGAVAYCLVCLMFFVSLIPGAVETVAPMTERLDLRHFPGFALHGVLAGHEADLVKRCQQSTTCKEHAAIVVEQFCTYFSQLSADPKAILSPRMLDMSAQFRDASAEQLSRHVLGIGEVISSEDLLRSLLEPGSVVAAGDPALFHEYLDKYGPALVGHFCVHEDLKDKSIKLHVGQPKGSCFNKLGKQRQ